MPNPSSAPIVFRVPGRDARLQVRGADPLPDDMLDGGTVKHSIVIATNRDGGMASAEAIPGEDVVVLQIAGGPELRLHPETARDLMNAQRTAAPTDRGAPLASAERDVVIVPMQLDWQGLEQGTAARGATRSFGGVLLSLFRVVTGLGKEPIVDFATSKVVALADGQVDEGVYHLSPEALVPLKTLPALKDRMVASENGAPVLVLVHGTLSSTSGTFGKLWREQPGIVEKLFSAYDNRVYALDHRTLAVSPIANALTLAKAAPAAARLHLLTHSRGGLVAEVFAGVCAMPDDAVERFDKALERARESWGRDEVPRREAAYDRQRIDLAELVAVVKAKGLTVERMVRVACPVRGTTLASKRLDAYISVFKWVLQLAGVPAVPELVGLLGAVAARKADPSELPGLEAQMPDSVLVHWLHAVDEKLPGDLRVVAGDMEGDSVGTWVKTLMADSFYWTDNDLVVQTRSMYGGAPRATNAVFVLDQGGSVSHFNYFRNDATARAILAALTSEKPAGFAEIGPLSWAGESSTGTRGTRAEDESERKKPLVFILPGIAGSNLTADNDRIWLDWHVVNGFRRLKYRSTRPDGVAADGVVRGTYDRLSDFLADTHAVVAFGYDWRKPLEEEAARLADDVDAALRAREGEKQPVSIVAHSMGGLLVRVMQIVRPDVWTRMMERKGARILMLGTPNAGSFAPMQVLSGDDRFGNLLGMVGAPFRSAEARKLMAEFPGLLQLQAGLSGPGAPLASEKEWQRIADADRQWLASHTIWHRLPLQLAESEWGVPSQQVLDQAVALRRLLDQQVEQASVLFANVRMVIGRADLTPAGYTCGAGDPGLLYLNLRNTGDGRVTRERAMLPGVPTWSVDADHSTLPRARVAFAAYLELLRTGMTTLLPQVTASVGRNAPEPAVYERSRPSRTRTAALPVQQPADALRNDGVAAEAGAPPRGAVLEVSVVHGDLSFVGEPLLLGHYRSMRLTGTEHVMDEMIGGTMQQSLLLGRYPLAPGSNQVFENARPHPFREIPRPQAVIVVGLGDEGSLRGETLVHTVRDGVLAWAQRVAEARGEIPIQFDLAATLMGSGGIGISAGESATCIAQGVSDANALLDNQKSTSRWPRVGRLSFIELYLDRATEAWASLRAMQATTTGVLDVTEQLVKGTGGMRRPPNAGYRGVDYDFVSSLTADKSEGDAIAFSVDTRRARTELRAKSLQLKLVRDMVKTSSTVANRDEALGRSLFKLLIPMELKTFLTETNALVLELDGGTAGIPWEVLETSGSRMRARPWAIRSKLLRKLRVTAPPPLQLDATADSDVLVIGEPACDPKTYPRLYGAREEALEVARLLSTRLDRDGRNSVVPLIRGDSRSDSGPDARTVINTLLDRDWRIVHVAGHGEPPSDVDGTTVPGTPDPRGVVLSGENFLGPREIRSMPVVPELVFVNCCHLAARSTKQLLDYNRATFAAGVAQSLIETGVRCVIAAGWAVEDDAAKTFATTFYASLLDGKRFIDAVSDARIASYNCGGNTWAAFQCYGDPDWIFRPMVSDAQRPPQPITNELVSIASPTALKLTLEMIAIEATNENAYKAIAEKLKFLHGRYGERWGGMGEIAEGFARAWSELGDHTRALEYYTTAVEAPDGSATIKALEQLCNTRARLAWESVRGARKRRDEARMTAANTPDGDNSAERALEAAIDRGVEDIGESLRLLEQVTSLQATMEREGLRGSTYKRLAMIQRTAGNTDAEQEAMKDSLARYRRSVELACGDDASNAFYPALNCLALELALGDIGPRTLDAELRTRANEVLTAKSKTDPDFWSVAGGNELRLYDAVAHGQLASSREGLITSYVELHTRVPSPRLWQSVFDTAYFVLERYATGVTAEAERDAAKALLTVIESFTQPAP